MKKSINDQLIEIYYFVDEAIKSYPQFANWRESNNHAPRFSDAEVITVALMQGYFGSATLSQTYQLVKANAGRAFPHLCSYKQWIMRLHDLSPLIGLLVLVSGARGSEAMKLFVMSRQLWPGPLMAACAWLTGAIAARICKTS